MTKLISDSLERRISFRQRMEMWLHIMMCGLCRRFRLNIIELRRRIRGSPPFDASVVDGDEPVSVTAMPAATKERLEAAIKRELG